MLSVVANDDHTQKPWSVYSLDSSHFNVRRRARTRNIRSEPRWFGAARKVFGQRLDNLAGAQDAEVAIGQQCDYPASF